jgi:PAS domain-containing protein
MEAFLQFALEQSEDLLLLLSEERIIFINKSFEEAFNVNREQVLKSQNLNCFDPLQAKKFKETSQAILKSNTEFVEEEFIVTVKSVRVLVKVEFRKYVNNVCCKWKFLKDDEKFNSELNRTKWLDVVDKHSDLCWFCIEVRFNSCII